MEKQLIQHGAVRYYRHGDEFWLDLIRRWKASGIGVRKFCEQNGVAPSTFHKRRADLAQCEASLPATSVMTPDACFIPVLPKLGILAERDRPFRSNVTADSGLS